MNQVVGQAAKSPSQQSKHPRRVSGLVPTISSKKVRAHHPEIPLKEKILKKQMPFLPLLPSDDLGHCTVTLQRGWGRGRGGGEREANIKATKRSMKLDSCLPTHQARCVYPSPEGTCSKPSTGTGR